MSEEPEWDCGDVVYSINRAVRLLSFSDGLKVGLLIVIAICEILSLMQGVKQ